EGGGVLGPRRDVLEGDLEERGARRRGRPRVRGEDGEPRGDEHEEADEAGEPAGARAAVFQERPGGRGGRHGAGPCWKARTSAGTRPASTAPYQRTASRPSGRCRAAGWRRPARRSPSHRLPSRAGQSSGTQPATNTPRAPAASVLPIISG